MKKFKEYLGYAMAIIGLFLAIATADGSDIEILLRITGVIMVAIGAYMAGAFEFQHDRQQHSK